jgi:hypothetical protein
MSRRPKRTTGKGAAPDRRDAAGSAAPAPGPFRRLYLADWLFAAGVFTIALLVRLVYLYSSPDAGWAHSVLFEGDAPRWLRWAVSLEQGIPYQAGLPLFSPAVAFVLYWLAPWSWSNPMLGMKALWCIATAMACALTYLATAQTVNRRVAVIAAALMTFSFGSFILSTSLNNEALYTPVLLLTVLASIAMVRSPQIVQAVALGASHGVAMLIRPEHALLFAMMLLYVLWKLGALQAVVGRVKAGGGRDWRVLARAGVGLGTVVLSAMVVCAPWNVRSSLALQEMNHDLMEPLEFEAAPVVWAADAREFIASLPAFSRPATFHTVNHIGEQIGLTTITAADLLAYFHKSWGYIPEPLPNWSFLSIKGGKDFAMANHPAARDGYTEVHLLLPGETELHTFIDRPDLLQLVNHGYAIGWGYITADFRGWLVRVGAKLGRFFDGACLGFTSRNLPLGLHGQRRPVDMFNATGGQSAAGRALYESWRMIILIGIATGAVLAVRRRVGGMWLLIILYKLIVTVLFYGYARQSASIAPAFFVLMALAIEYAGVRLAPTVAPLRRWAKPAAIAALLLTVALDISGSLRRPVLTVTGQVTPVPMLGEDAFSTHRAILVRPERP